MTLLNQNKVSINLTINIMVCKIIMFHFQSLNLKWLQVKRPNECYNQSRPLGMDVLQMLSLTSFTGITKCRMELKFNVHIHKDVGTFAIVIVILLEFV